MRAGGQSAKGSQFERQVCRELSLWLTDGESEDVFWRSAMSGGRATVARRRGVKLASSVGDVSAIHARGQKFMDNFAVECKHVRDLQFKQAVTGANSNMVSHYAKAREEAAAHGKEPFLVAKQNRTPTILVVSHRAAGSIIPPYFKRDHCRAVINTRNVSNIYVFLWDEFLAYCMAKDVNFEPVRRPILL